MKKLLSICFLSILFTLAGFVARAQAPTQDCCFWLENITPEVINVHGQPVTLQDFTQKVTRADIGRTDAYMLNFKNTCNLPENTKVSVEWQLYRNGRLVNDDMAHYCDFRIFIKYEDLPEDQQWIGGTVRNGDGICNGRYGAARTEGFPGTMQVGLGGTAANSQGYVSIGNQYLNLDYFFLYFFETTNVKFEIQWRYPGKYDLAVRLRERKQGTPFGTLYMDNNQLYPIGGHQSKTGNVLLTDTLYHFEYTNNSIEVCQGTTTDDGITYSEVGVYSDTTIKSHIDNECAERKVIDSVNVSTVYVRHNPQITTTDVPDAYCSNETVAFEVIKNRVVMDNTGGDEVSDRILEWSTDGSHFFAAEPPLTNLLPGTHTYYVKQINIYNNFDTELRCESNLGEIKMTINPVPGLPTLHDAFICSNENFKPTDYVTADADCELVWVPALTADEFMLPAGDYTYKVYQKNTATGCFDPDKLATLNVKVYAAPETNLTATPNPVCAEAEITLTAKEGYTSYSWEEDGTAMTQNTNVIKVTKDVPAGDESKDYTYTVTVGQSYDNNVNCTATEDITVTVNALPAAPGGKAEYTACASDNNPAQLTMTVTPGQFGDNCKWYLVKNDGSLAAPVEGTTCTVDLATLAPSTNEDKTVVYKVTSVNATTGCETAISHAKEVKINFYKNPVVTIAEVIDACPNSDITLTATTTGYGPYTYTWDNGITETDAEVTFHSLNECNHTYYINVIAKDAHNCVGTGSYELVVNDNKPLSFTSLPTNITYDAEANVYTTSHEVLGCVGDATPVNAPETLEDFYERYGVTLVNHCENGATLAFNETQDPDQTSVCESIRLWNFTITDACGNTVTLVDIIKVKDTEAPTIATTSISGIEIDAVPADGCKYDAPSFEEFKSKFELAGPSDNCAALDELTYNFEILKGKQYINAANAEDIFSGLNSGDKLYVKVTVTDNCNNAAEFGDVLYFVVPDKLTVDGALTVDAPNNTICLGEMANLSINQLKIKNGEAPYTYAWTVTNDANAHMTVATGNETATIKPIAAGTYTITLTVTDSKSCEATTSLDLTVNSLPVVTISGDETVCPNVGTVTLTATATNVDYTWNDDPTNNASTFDLAIDPAECDKIYTNIVEVKDQTTGCVNTATFEVHAIDNEAPTSHPEFPSAPIEVSVKYQEGCVKLIPNFLVLVNPDIVTATIFTFTDNCTAKEDIQLFQTPEAGLPLPEGTTIVKVWAKDACGNATDTIVYHVKPAADTLTIALDGSDNEICYGESVDLTTTTTNGIAPLTYAWEHNNALTATSTTVTPEPNGDYNATYKVTVTDKNGCEASDEFVVKVNRVPEEADLTLAFDPNTYCDNDYNIYDGKITGQFQDPAYHEYYFRMKDSTIWYLGAHTYDKLKEGNYTFETKSDKGCIGPDVSINVTAATTNVYAQVAVNDNTTCDPRGTFNAPYNGSIEITNPQVGYTYSLKKANVTVATVTYASGELIFNNLAPANNYSIEQITDKLCRYNKVGIEIKDMPETIGDGDPVISNYKNCTTPDGKVTFTNLGEGYTYILNGVTIVTTDATTAIEFTGLEPKDYSYTIVSPNNCEYNGSVTVGTDVDVTEPTLSQTPNINCDQSLTGTGSVIVLNPVSGYTYTLDNESLTYNGSNEIIFKNKKDGIYTVTTKDEFGCSATPVNQTVNYEPEVIAKPNITVEDNTACDETLANGKITINNYNNDYNYTINDVALNANTKDALGTGSYHVVVTNPATGCSNDTTVEVKNVQYTVPFTETVNVTNNINCTGEPNGSISVDKQQGCTYELHSATGAPVAEWTNLAAGTYTIEKTHTATACKASSSKVVVDQFTYPVVTLTATPNTHCDNNVNGTIKVESDVEANITLGAETHNGVTEYTFEGLSAITYSITVVDVATGCEKDTTEEVIDELYNVDVDEAIATTANKNCVNSNGSITFDKQDGYSYKLTKGTEEFEEPWNTLTAGTYTLTKTHDETGCSATKDITILDDNEYPVVTLSVVDNINCKDEKNGQITVTSNVNSEITIDGQSTQTGINTYTFTGLKEAKYTIHVKNLATGCVKDTTADVHDNLFDVVFNETPISNPNTTCSDYKKNGSVEMPGVNDYVFELYDGANKLNPVTAFIGGDRTWNELGDGDYRMVKVHTASGCSAEKTVIVIDKPNKYSFSTATDANTLCNIIAAKSAPVYDGKITVTPMKNGETQLYTDFEYAIDNSDWQASNVFEGLNAGIYNIIIRNRADSCTASGSAVVLDGRDHPTLTTNPTDNSNCKDEKNGTIEVTSTLPAIIYLIDPEQHSSTDATTYTFTDLPASAYTVGAVTSKNCSTTEQVTVSETLTFPSFDLSATNNTMCAPRGDIEGNATITVSNAGGNYEYTLTRTPPAPVKTYPAQTTLVWNNVGYAGETASYTIKAVDLNTGCEFGKEVRVISTQYEPTFTTASTANTICVDATHEANGTLTINFDPADPANANYNVTNCIYSINDVDYFASKHFTERNYTPDGTYYVKDTMLNCKISGNYVVENHSATPQLTIPAKTYCLNTEDDVTINPTSSTHNDEFSYLWNNGETTNTIHLTNDVVGEHNYDVTVKSNISNCQVTATLNVTVNPLPEPVISIERGATQLCQTDEGQQLIVTPAGLTYKWNDNSTAQTLALGTLTPGTHPYSVIATDGNGCKGEASFDLVVKPAYFGTRDTALCADSSVVFTENNEKYYFDKDGATNDNNHKTATVHYIPKSDQYCDSVITWNITLLGKPNFTITLNPFEKVYCVEDNFEDYTIDIPAAFDPSDVKFTWVDGETPVNMSAPITAEMNGKEILIHAENACYNYSIDSNIVKVYGEPSFTTALPNEETLCYTSNRIADPTYDCDANGHYSACTYKWQINHAGTYEDFTWPNPLTNTELDGAQLRFEVTGACGVSIHQDITIHVDTLVKATIEDFAICKETPIDANILNLVIANEGEYGEILSKSYSLDGAAAVEFTDLNIPTTDMTEGNHTIKLIFRTHCGDGETNEATLTVRTQPTITCIPDGQFNICLTAASASATNPLNVKPTVNSHLGNISEQGWQINSTNPIDDNAWTSLSASELDATYTGSHIRYFATNECGTVYSNAVLVTVTPPAEITGTLTDHTFCVGETLELEALTSSNTVPGETGYYISKTTDKTGEYEPFDNNAITLTTVYNGKYVYYFADGICEDAYSDTIMITVNPEAHFEILEDSTRYCVTNESVYKVKIGEGDVLTATTSNEDIVKATIKPVADQANTFTVKFFNMAYSEDEIICTMKSHHEGSCKDSVWTDTVRTKGAPTLTPLEDVHVCSGETIQPTPVATENNAGTVSYEYYWKSGSVNLPGAAGRMNVQYSDSGRVVLVEAENACGKTSDEFTVHVDTTYVTLDAPETICYNASYNGIEINAMPNDYTYDVVGIDADKVTETGNKLTFNLAQFETQKGEFSVSITTAANKCPATTVTHTVKVIGAPIITTHDVAPACESIPANAPGTRVSDMFETANAFEIDANKYDDGTTPSITYEIVTKAGVHDNQYTSQNNISNNLIPALADYDSAYLKVTVDNGCVEKTESVQLFVYGGYQIDDLVLTPNCDGLTLRDFVANDPEHFLEKDMTPAHILGSGYEVEDVHGGRRVITEDEALTSVNATQIRYFITTNCYPDYSNWADIPYKFAPVFIDDQATLTYCDKETFTCDVDPANVKNNYVASDILYKLGDVTLTPGTSTVNTGMNGQIVDVIIHNECGYDTLYIRLTVNPLPEPVLNDTIVCDEDELEFPATEVVGTETYNNTWYVDGTKIVENADHKLMYKFIIPTTLPDDAIQEQPFTVKLVQENANTHCVDSTEATYTATNNPILSFSSANDTVYATTGEVSSAHYEVNVENFHCADPDTVVFLEIKFFYNDQLIKTTETLDSLIIPMIEGHNHTYVIDTLSWLSTAGNQKVMISRYQGPIPYTDQDYVEGCYHYPNSTMLSSQKNLDCVYLHFLMNRPLRVQFAPFRKPGTYKVEYTLYSTTSTDRFQTEYRNTAWHTYDPSVPADTNLRIGGSMSIDEHVILKKLALKTITIVVDGEDIPYQGDRLANQVSGISSLEAENATMTIYPNPATTAAANVNVKVEGLTGDVLFTVSDISGKIINSERMYIPEGESYNFKHNVSSYNPGLYFITLKNDAATITRKMVISK